MSAIGNTAAPVPAAASKYSWGSMLRTARAPVTILVIGALALLAPPQTRDMLVFLDNGGIWPALSFLLALAVFGVSSWLWSRAVLAARFGISDSTRDGSGPVFDWFAFCWLPRVILLASFLIGVVIAIESATFKTALGAAALGVVFLFLAYYRKRGHSQKIAEPPVVSPRTTFRLWLAGAWRNRLTTLLAAAPFGRAVSIPLLLLGLVPLLFGVLEAFAMDLHLPNRAARVFPGPGIAILLLGLMIGPLTATTFVFDALTTRIHIRKLKFGLGRPPVMTGLFLYIFVVVPALCRVHTVRLIDAPPAQPLPLPALLENWAVVCQPGPGPIRPIIVAVSGGATRAGIWGEAVIDQVLQAQRPGGPALFAVSSVSGGSLGAAAAMSVLSAQTTPCNARGLDALRPAADGHVPLDGDALGPLLGGWLLDDIPRAAFDPVAALVNHITGHRPNGGDSAEALEHGFEDLWTRAQPKAPGWDQPFLSLFYNGNTYRAGMPLWFANGTDAGTGNRVITSPILAPVASQDTTPWPFHGARDFITLMKADVSVSTAINNSARFPFLEPFGEMLQRPDLNPHHRTHREGSLIDGGYFENEGLQTALDLAEFLSLQKPGGRPVEPIIVQATGDGGTVRKSDVMTCLPAADGAYIADKTYHGVQVLAPLVGLVNTRGGHSATLLRQAHDQYCPGRFFHFFLPSDHGRDVPLNWALSDNVASFIWSAVDDNDVPNRTELAKLQSALGNGSPK